ncbi:AraC family transcriptional regulator, partial [Klebsiella pneumoniae]
CGFNSLAHFSRRFRARYGSTPLELLREPGAEGMGSSTWHGDGAGT